MKKQILFVGAFFCLIHGFAQPVLNHALNYVPGLKFTTYRLPASPGITSGSTGAAQTWNFSSLVVIPSDTTLHEILYPDSAFLGAQYPMATHVEKTSDGLYIIFRDSASHTNVVGTIPSPNMEIRYNDPYSVLKRPLHYQDLLHDVSAREMKINGENFTGTGKSSMVVDGFGTLVLPYQTFPNVLRVKLTQEYRDSSETTGIITTSNIVGYYWFNNTSRSPLLQIDSLSISNPFYLHNEVLFRSLKSETAVTGIVNVPNTFNTYLCGNAIIVDFELKTGDELMLKVLDISGKKVFSRHEVIRSAISRHTIQLEQLPENTIYFGCLLIRRDNQQYFSSLKLLR